MKPFDLAAAKAGKPIQSRAGKKVTFVAHLPEAKERGRIVSSRRCFYGKRKYRSEDLAKSVMLEMRQKKLPGAEFLHTYRCPLCEKFHLGKTGVPQDEKILLQRKIAARRRQTVLCNLDISSS